MNKPKGLEEYSYLDKYKVPLLKDINYLANKHHDYDLYLAVNWYLKKKGKGITT